MASNRGQSLGEIIRKNRLERNLSQQELARLVGVSSGQIISNWERNYGSLISSNHLKKLMLLFKLDPSKTVAAYLEIKKMKVLDSD